MIGPEKRAQLKSDIAKNREAVEKMLAEAKAMEAAMEDLPSGSKERERMQAAYDSLLDAARQLAESTHRLSSTAVKSF